MNINYYWLFLSLLFAPIITMEDHANPENRKVNIQQLQVKNQFDIDGGGELSCGYHALKNALIIALNLIDSGSISSEGQNELKSAEIVDNLFGNEGIWRNKIETYKNKKLAEDYLYNYLIYNMAGDKEHIYLKMPNEDFTENEYALRLKLGHIKFTSIDQNLQFEKHLYLKNILVEASKDLVKNFDYDKESDLSNIIEYSFNKNQIFDAINNVLSDKSRNRNPETKYNFSKQEVQDYLPHINNINFIVIKGTITSNTESLPFELRGTSPYDSHFSDNLSSTEIEHILEDLELNKLSICIIGDKGLVLKEEYQGNYNDNFKELVKNIHERKPSIDIFLINERNHWIACVIQSNDEYINYYLANSSTNSSIKDNSYSFKDFREIIEEKDSEETDFNDEDINNIKEPSNLNKQLDSLKYDKDKESILSDLRSPYSHKSTNDLPSLQLLTNSKTSPIINQIQKTLKEYPELMDKIKCGLILYGPPGTGKTVLAEIICREANRKVFFIGGGDLRTSYQASTQSILRNIIQLASEYPEPSAIIIDEIDAIGSNVTSQHHSEDNMALAYLKTCTQALDSCKNKPYIFCTTNHMGKIDKAIKRRFKSLLIDLPEEERLSRIIKFYLSKNKDAEFLKQNVNESFINLISRYGFQEKLSCDNVQDIINDAIMDEKFNSPIIHKLPWRYTKLFWDGTDFEKKLYNSYCNLIENKNNNQKEEDKERDKSRNENTSSQPDNQYFIVKKIYDGSQKTFDGACSGAGMAVGAGLVTLGAKKIHKEWKNGEINTENLKGLGRGALTIAKMFIPTQP